MKLISEVPIQNHELELIVDGFFNFFGILMGKTPLFLGQLNKQLVDKKLEDKSSIPLEGRKK
jgi:hypothetical protein